MAKRINAKARIVKPGKLRPPEGFHYMPDGTLMKNIDHKNEPQNTVQALEEDALGRQEFEPSELESLAKLQYEFLTEKPTRSLTLRPYEGALEGIYGVSQKRRVALMRYTGQVVEVNPEEYDTFRDNIDKGIYFAMDFIWPLVEIQGEMDLITRQRLIVDETIAQVPVELQQKAKAWLAENIKEVDSLKRRLKVNPKNYVSKFKYLKEGKADLEEDNIIRG